MVVVEARLDSLLWPLRRLLGVAPLLPLFILHICPYVRNL